MLLYIVRHGDPDYVNDCLTERGWKQADILPHALINNVDTKLGRDGSILKDYVKWLSDRILKLRADESYSPILHIDVYGTIGQAFGDDNFVAQADYLAELEEAAKPFKLRIEGPMDAGEREKQMLCLKGLREELDKRGINVELVADEWCNTLEDVIYFCDNKLATWLRSRHPTWAVSTTPSKLFCTARSTASALTRAVPATRPTAPARSASTALWLQSPTRSSLSPVWVLTRAS